MLDCVAMTSVQKPAAASTIAPDGGVQPRTAVWPFLFSTALLWSAIAALMLASLSRTEGRLIYALDDPYIHMAMAKNVALHGIWGATPDGFTSSSSSIAWTASLALLFLVFGVHDVVPFIVNIVLGTVTVWTAHRLLTSRIPAMSATSVCVTLTVLVLTAPMPALVFAGQEHILHLLCTVVFVFMAADLVVGPRVPLRSRNFAAVAGMVLLLPLVRYEGLYPVVITAALLALRRRITQALALVITAATPVVVYAAISVAQGWSWAPNSVLLKGNLPDWHTLDGIRNLLGYWGYSTLLGLPAVAFLVYAAIALFAMRVSGGIWTRTSALLMIFVPMALMHLQYSQPRAFWLFRYEAYVVAAGVMVTGAALFERGEGALLSRPRLVTLLQGAVLGLLLAISPLTDRAVRAAAIVPQATANIYEQQYQMGRFLREYYPSEPVALNDIGAASYLSDAKVLDLVGLASMDIARLRREGLYSTAGIDEAARDHGVRIAIVYDRWFPDALPPGWIKAGSWRIRNGVVVGSNTVSFYATSPEEHRALTNHLREFESALPPGVKSGLGR